MRLPRRGKRILTAVLILLGAVLLLPKPVAAITPDDPKVQNRVKRALQYLSAARDDRLGGDCLIGLCFKKAGEPDDHPKILRGITRCKELDFNTCDNYSMGIALMFLCEVDPQTHQVLINKIVEEALKRQKPHGGWGYKERPTGDTSQTQYAVLGLWMAKHYGNIQIPIDRIEGVGGWLMRTQDPSGGWQYQGEDPGSLQRIPQPGHNLTLSASGAGSIYMVADLLQVTQRVDVANAPKSKALQDVPEPGKKVDARGPLTVNLKPEDIKATLAGADRYLGNSFKEQGQWNHYYMYALERYQSFREKAGGARDNSWYDQGFAYLDRTQTAEGCWTAGQASDNDVTATCFATLFLLRSAQKAIIKKMGIGYAKGGNGLPPDVKSLQVTEGGEVLDNKIVLNTEQILELINKGESEAVQRLAEEKEAIALSSNKTERKSQIEFLRKQVGVGSYNVRKIAVTAIGNDRDLKNVPLLLYALTDPDPRIVVLADKGLRFISRKVNGVGLPEKDPTVAEIQSAKAAWRAWYLSIRPDAELID